ncbi:MAG: outer membrane beta-barrel protein [Bryobacteraceae bacterium]
MRHSPENIEQGVPARRLIRLEVDVNRNHAGAKVWWARCAAAAALFGGLVVTVPALYGQAAPAASQPAAQTAAQKQPTAEQPAAQQPELKQPQLKPPAVAPLDFGQRRWAIGGRAGFMFTDLMTGTGIGTSQSDPPVISSTQSVSRSSALVGGGTVQFSFTKRLTLVADVLYRKASFTTGYSLTQGEDDEDTSDDERDKTSMYSQTHADLWDVPIMLRYTDLPRGSRARSFFGAGIAYRRVGRIHSFTEYTYDYGYTEDDITAEDETPAVPERKSVFGIVAGVGVEVKAAGGLKITPEVRYTHWMNRNFVSSTVQNTKYQLEFILGLTF